MLSVGSSFMRRARYNFGGIGDGMDQNAVPFDLRLIEEKYNEGSQTPNMVISFGGGLTENALTVDGADLDDFIFLIDMHCVFTTPTLNLRTQNLHRSGATTASPVWGVIPKNRVAVNLMQFLHCNTIETITVHMLSYTGAQAENSSPVITETRIFGSCFIIYLAPWGYGDYVVFAFTFLTLKWELHDFDQTHPNDKIGTRAWEFDFSSAAGSLSE